MQTLYRATGWLSRCIPRSTNHDDRWFGGYSDELVITFSPGITYENHVIIGELIMCSQSAVKEERGLKIQIAFFDEPVEPGEILLFKSVCLVYVGPERILS